MVAGSIHEKYVEAFWERNQEMGRTHADIWSIWGCDAELPSSADMTGANLQPVRVFVEVLIPFGDNRRQEQVVEDFFADGVEDELAIEHLHSLAHHIRL